MSADVDVKKVKVVPRKLTVGHAFTVYAVDDAHGNLLYVGQTTDLNRRLQEHARLAVWWQFADSVETFSRPTREAAQSLERELIRGCKPSYNQYLSGSTRGAREYLALARYGINADTPEGKDLVHELSVAGLLNEVLGIEVAS